MRISSRVTILSILASASLLLAACLPVDIVRTVAEFAFAVTEPTAAVPTRVPTLVSPAVSVAWQREAVHLDETLGDPRMVSAGGILLLLHLYGMEALHATDGSQLPPPKYGSIAGIPMSIAASETLIFLGTDFGYVIAIDPTTNGSAWSTLARSLAKVYSLHLADGFLFAEVSPSNVFALNPLDGAVLNADLPYATHTWSPSLGTVISDGIYTLSLSDSMRLWETPIRGNVYASPIFTESRIAVRAGEKEGHAYLLDRQDGKVLSVSSSSVVSNIVSDGHAYFGLTVDGALRSWDLDTGQESALVQFGHDPIDPDRNPRVGYHLAFDASAAMLFAYLGDVSQLTAFNVKPPPM